MFVVALGIEREVIGDFVTVVFVGRRDVQLRTGKEAGKELAHPEPFPLVFMLLMVVVAVASHILIFAHSSILFCFIQIGTIM